MPRIKLKDLPPQMQAQVSPKPKRSPKKTCAAEAARVEQFRQALKLADLADYAANLVPELQFHPTRKWRFDYAIPCAKIAIEIEGGAWSNGRHSRGMGFVADMEKYREAVKLGWRLLRYTPQQWRARAGVLKDIIAIHDYTICHQNTIQKT